MAKIISNQKINNTIFLLKVAGSFKGRMGQFYMLRGWDVNHLILSRPFSIFDIDSSSVSFLYKVKGMGTKLLSQLKDGDKIEIFGPYGNGFPEVSGKIALVGGGIGMAPLALAAKYLRNRVTVEMIDIYLGFKEKTFMTDYFDRLANHLIIDIDSFISQKIDINQYDNIFICGPEDMMKSIVNQKKLAVKPNIYICLEKKMGCGLGACLSCTCKTKTGNKLVCKDGPVFPGEDVFFEQ